MMMIDMQTLPLKVPREGVNGKIPTPWQEQQSLEVVTTDLAPGVWVDVTEDMPYALCLTR